MNHQVEPARKAAAVGSAAVIAIGVALLDWPTFTVLALYWLENVIAGVFTAARLLAAGARTRRYGETLFALPFFVVHYGMFCLVHGVVVAVFFGAIDEPEGLVDPVRLIVQRLVGDGIGLLVVAVMIAGAALDARRAMAAVEADDEKAVGRIMFEPYGRIVVLHLVLIGGGFVMHALQWPPLTALLLVAFKLLYDLRGSQHAPGSPHAAAGGRRSPAA